ncbi:MAG: methyltransferase type 11 [Desulfovibrio sp. S3730MH75]|nr:MAG: methyltransferase type 11 [Desulfovibrio sp. S3730MH75]
MKKKKENSTSIFPDLETYIRILKETNPLRESILYSVIQALNLPDGSRGLDAGCGIGLQTLLLAKEVEPHGHITGLDITPEFIQYGNKIVMERGLSNQITFREGDAANLPFEDNTFDWVWSSDCVGYPVTDNPIQLIKELKRVVKPGGTLAILAWSSQQLLPGYPLLEARLNAVSSGYSRLIKGKKPEQHFLRALGWFADAGFQEFSAKTFVSDFQAPLNNDIVVGLGSLFQMLWGEPLPELAKKDWAEFERLCLPESPDFILNEPNYYAFFTYSMFFGKAA